MENVAALRNRGLDQVLGDLASLGFDAEWSVLSACAVGAPHTRERLFILAHPQGGRGFQRGRIELAQDSDPQRNLCHWETEPEPCRVADGTASRMDRLSQVGNAVVPQVAELVGRLIVEAA